MITQHQNFQRRTHGTIDLDFHRQWDLTQRRIAMTRFLVGMGKMVRPLIAVAAIVAAICVAPPRDGPGWTAPTAGYSGTSHLGALTASAQSSSSQNAAR